MRMFLVLLALLMLALAGCTTDPAEADSDADGFSDAEETAAGSDPMDAMSQPDEVDDEAPDIQTEFSFGSGSGCSGREANGELACASFQAGPDASASEGGDGFWIPLTPDYRGVAFTSTIQSATEDSDCVFTNEDLQIIANAHNGGGVCKGSVPRGAAYMFIYSWQEPHQGITVTYMP